MALGCYGIRPGEELQEAASLVTIGKLCFSKYMSGFISVNRSSLDDSCVFIWSSFFQTYPVSMQVCINVRAGFEESCL